MRAARADTAGGVVAPAKRRVRRPRCGPYKVRELSPIVDLPPGHPVNPRRTLIEISTEESRELSTEPFLR